MLSDPQTITINAVACVLNRIMTGDLKSVYQDTLGTNKLTISHQTSKGRIRRMIRFDRTAIVADPITALNDYETGGVYLVIDEPEVGFTDAELTDIWTGFKNWADSTLIGKVLGSQS